MDVRRRKQGKEFIEDLTDKGVRLFLTRMERKVCPTTFSSTRYFGISPANSSRMTRHIKFRYNHDLTFCCISYNLFDIFLCIKSRRSLGIMPVSDSPFLCQFRETFDFNAPTGFVRQVPVKYVQVQRCHQIQILLHLLLSKEMPAFI